MAGIVGTLVASTSQVGAEKVSTGSIRLVGTVADTCSLGSATGTPGDGIIEDGANGGVDKIVTITNFSGDDGRHLAKEFMITYANATCNYATRMKMVSTNGGMKPNGTVTAIPNFTSVVHYTATATWGSGQTLSLNTSNGTGDPQGIATPATAAPLTVYIQTKPTTQPLLSQGNPYVDVITLQIGHAT